jgi:hypothetical protein
MAEMIFYSSIAQQGCDLSVILCLILFFPHSGRRVLNSIVATSPPAATLLPEKRTFCC